MITERFHFSKGLEVEANAAIPVERFPRQAFEPEPQTYGADRCAPPLADETLAEEFEPVGDVTPVLASLKPLGQLRESFILAVNHDGLWIIDQHCAHERVLFEKVSRQRARQEVESQRMLMPIVIELTPAQQAIFSEISD